MNLTVPLPLPLLPDEMKIQLTLLVAVHSQPLAVITLTEPMPPNFAKDWLVEESVNVQFEAAAA